MMIYLIPLLIHPPATYMRHIHRTPLLYSPFSCSAIFSTHGIVQYDHHSSMFCCDHLWGRQSIHIKIRLIVATRPFPEEGHSVGETRSSLFLFPASSGGDYYRTLFYHLRFGDLCIAILPIYYLTLGVAQIPPSVLLRRLPSVHHIHSRRRVDGRWTRQRAQVFRMAQVPGPGNVRSRGCTINVRPAAVRL